MKQSYAGSIVLGTSYVLALYEFLVVLPSLQTLGILSRAPGCIAIADNPPGTRTRYGRSAFDCRGPRSGARIRSLPTPPADQES
jgi:hypothetical protein